MWFWKELFAPDAKATEETLPFQYILVVMLFVSCYKTQTHEISLTLEHGNYFNFTFPYPLQWVSESIENDPKKIPSKLGNIC